MDLKCSVWLGWYLVYYMLKEVDLKCSVWLGWRLVYYILKEVDLKCSVCLGWRWFITCLNKWIWNVVFDWVDVGLLHA